MSMSYTRGYSTNSLIKSLYARKAALEDDMVDIAAKGAKEIMELSRAYAPVDEGHVEEAHHVIVRSTRRGNPAFDVEVELNDETEGYLDWLHNDPTYELGPLSQEKAAASGQPVGYKFLERAFDKKKPQILKEYQSITRRFTRK